MVVDPKEASRLVCKFLRGILTPILVQVMKDRKNDSLYALGICHHPHRASPAPDFPERSFYEVGGSQAAPKLRPLDLKRSKAIDRDPFPNRPQPLDKPSSSVNQTASKLP